MQGKAHVLFGIGSAIVTGIALNLTTQAQIPEFSCLLVGAIAGSVLPDIDNETSTISNKCSIISKPFNLLRHRGFTHSILNILILVAIYLSLMKFNYSIFINIMEGILIYTLWKMFKGKGLIRKIIAMGFALDIAKRVSTGILLLGPGILLGIVGHILCDMFTMAGVELVFPFFGNIRIARFNSNSLANYVVVGGLVATLYGIVLYLL